MEDGRIARGARTVRATTACGRRDQSWELYIQLTII